MKKESIFIELKIPIKPYVKKYISVRYGVQHTLTKNSLLGILIFNLLDKNVSDPFQDEKDLKEKYIIEIPQQYFFEKGFAINSRKKHFIGVCLEKLFVEDFLSFVDVLISKLDVTAAEGIRVFLEQYDISENELKYESMYKKYQRHSNFKIKLKKK